MKNHTRTYREPKQIEETPKSVRQIDIRKILSIILIIVILVCSFIVGKELINNKKANDEVKRINNIVSETVKEEGEEFTKETFRKLKLINKDMVGYIVWDTGIIEQPVVQARDNDYYLRRSFYGEYSDSGVPFMDSYATLDDMNFTIYGHNSWIDETVMFTPINAMGLDQKIYEENSEFKLYTANEVRYYTITHIYYISEDEYQTYDFQQTYITPEDWDRFIAFPNRKNLIQQKSGGLEYGNNFITLQTCKKWDSSQRTVLIGREIMRKKY